MAFPQTSVTDIVATTLQGYSGELADNITNHNALLTKLNQKGNKVPATGRTIVQELEYQQNSTVQWYSGAEPLDTSPTDTFTYAEFNYKQLAGNVVINGLEQIQNSGKEAVHNLLRSRIRNLERSLKNTVATALYADGTGSSSKEIGGLQLLVSDAGTGTVGGIVSSTWSFWQNYKYDFSDNSVTAGVTTMQHAMNTAFVNITRGADKPDMWVGDTIYYLYYLESLTANQRFVDEKMAQSGFMNVMFMSAPCFFDDQAPASHMYGLNTDYLYLRPAKGREFVPLGEKSSINQDAMVMPVVWAGNMTCSNRSLQAVIVA
jgi:hypothetical protein